MISIIPDRLMVPGMPPESAPPPDVSPPTLSYEQSKSSSTRNKVMTLQNLFAANSIAISILHTGKYAASVAGVLRQVVLVLVLVVLVLVVVAREARAS
jgi:hypothetical protein